MIILPIGHEESSVRRLPWVTLGLMGLSLVVLLSADPTPPAPPPRFRRRKNVSGAAAS